MNRKQIITTIITLIAVILIGTIDSNIVKANTIEQYELQIAENTSKIEDIEKIKQQLHITAEMLRSEQEINNGFDSYLSEKWYECNNVQQQLYTENDELRVKIDEEKSKRIFVGYFTCTHYDSCYDCNGKWGGKTALGTKLTPYKTIAVDPSVIPLGSKVEILDKEYIAEDTGGAIKGNKIDICVKSHSEAYQKGILKNVPVYIIKESR